MADIKLAPQRFTPPTSAASPRSSRVGRPDGPAEQLVVPGKPRAIENRPTHATGRLPVAAPTPPTPSEHNEALPFDVEAIQREVKLSTEYQALKGAGLIKDESEPEQPPASPPPEQSAAPSETVQITEIRYERIEIQIHQELRIEVRQQTRAAPSPRPTEEPVQNERPPRRSDPLALDLNGNGLETTGITNGVQFDINADGVMDQTSFISGGDAFLAIDANNNGRIDDGRELFGDQNGDANGYLALAHHDDNNDGRIDHEDAVYQQLRLFTQNAQGEQQLRSLSDEGISSLSLNYQNSAIALNRYDSITQLSSFERIDGSRGETGDLLLGYKSQH